MNWKQFKNEVLKDNKNLCFIDRLKTTRGLNEVRILRFFFSGDFKPFVDFYNAIGFYIIIEKSHFWNTYDIQIELINKDTQKGGDTLLFITENKAETIYKRAKEKIKELMTLKVEVV